MVHQSTASKLEINAHLLSISLKDFQCLIHVGLSPVQSSEKWAVMNMQMARDRYGGKLPKRRQGDGVMEDIVWSTTEHGRSARCCLIHPFLIKSLYSFYPSRLLFWAGRASTRAVAIFAVTLHFRRCFIRRRLSQQLSLMTQIWKHYVPTGR